MVAIFYVIFLVFGRLLTTQLRRLATLHLLNGPWNNFWEKWRLQQKHRSNHKLSCSGVIAYLTYLSVC